MILCSVLIHDESVLFFFKYTATTEIYTLSLHDALPIYFWGYGGHMGGGRSITAVCSRTDQPGATSTILLRCEPIPNRDRKSTRLNSSHSQISYAVFCLKKNNIIYQCHCPTASICLDHIS